MTPGGERAGVVLVAVLLLSAVAWSLLAAAMTQAWLHARLAQGTLRGGVAGAAAEGEIQRLLAIIAADPAMATTLTLAAELLAVGGCTFDLIAVQPLGDGVIVTLDAHYQGASVRREGTVRAP